MPLVFSVTATPDPDDLARVGDGLTAFNESDVGPAHKLPLAVLVRDGDGVLVAGLSGQTTWGWLYVQWLWVSEAQRGHKIAARLLADAEAEAVARGCHGAFIDTFNPVALKVYTQAGYVPFGALEDFPKGRTRSFLQKRLGA